MPAHIYFILILSVVLAAAGTIALVSATGVNFLWVGLAVLLLTLAFRKLKW